MSVEWCFKHKNEKFSGDYVHAVQIVLEKQLYVRANECHAFLGRAMWGCVYGFYQLHMNNS